MALSTVFFNIVPTFYEVTHGQREKSRDWSNDTL